MQRESEPTGARSQRLTIQDTGVGIPETALPLVFERFYRVDDARSRDHGGAGLGLAITKSIVEEHGGSVLVESEEGEGTTFAITLPTAVSGRVKGAIAEA